MTFPLLLFPPISLFVVMQLQADATLMCPGCFFALDLFFWHSSFPFLFDFEKIHHHRRRQRSWRRRSFWPISSLHSEYQAEEGRTSPNSSSNVSHIIQLKSIIFIFISVFTVCQSSLKYLICITVDDCCTVRRAVVARNAIVFSIDFEIENKENGSIPKKETRNQMSDCSFDY